VSDGSEFSAGAIAEAIHLAHRCNAELHALTVVMATPEIESFGEQLIRQEEEQAQSHLDGLRARAAESGVDCQTSLRHGPEIYEEIVEAADEGHADLIVMGRRGKSGLLKTMMGSTTAKVIGYADCNVLVVPRAARIDGGGVLVAVDGSRYSEAAAVVASTIAQRCDKPITVLSAVHEDFNERRRSEMKEAVERITGLLGESGVQAEGEIIDGRPAQAIVESAKGKGADLVVVGSHGRSGLEKVLLGSVSERVVGQSDCAVLVVKA
jgi:nucleotide-binding universal stress UspA family protein